MDKACDLGILLGDAFVGINEDQAHICPLDGIDGTHIGVLLNGIIHLALAAHTGGIDKAILSGLIFKIGVDGIAGGTCHIGHDDTLFTQNLVQQAGFAHIGLTNNGHLDNVTFFLFPIFFRDVLQHPIQQVAGTVAVDSRGFKQITDAQTVEFKHIGVSQTNGVALIDSQRNGLAGLAEHGCHIFVCSGHTGTNVYHHHNAICQFDTDLCLTTHELQHIIFRIGFDTTGIHQAKMTAAPFAIAIDPVTGHTGGILHDGGTVTGQFIKEHGFTNIGSANNSHQGFCHEITSFLLIHKGIA